MSSFHQNDRSNTTPSALSYLRGRGRAQSKPSTASQLWTANQPMPASQAIFPSEQTTLQPPTTSNRGTVETSALVIKIKPGHRANPLEEQINTLVLGNQRERLIRRQASLDSTLRAEISCWKSYVANSPERKQAEEKIARHREHLDRVDIEMRRVEERIRSEECGGESGVDRRRRQWLEDLYFHFPLSEWIARLVEWVCMVLIRMGLIFVMLVLAAALAVGVHGIAGWFKSR